MIAIWYLMIYTNGTMTVIPQRDQAQCEWSEKKLKKRFFLVECIPGVIPPVVGGVER